MDNWKPFPRHLRTEVEAKIHALLQGVYDKLEACQAFVGFVDEQGTVQDPIRLPDSDKKVLLLNVDQGLTGYAIKHESLVAWPDDPESDRHYVPVDSGITEEIVSPIACSTGIIGVAWLDRKRRSKSSRKKRFSDEERACFADFVLEVATILNEIAKEEEEAPLRLKELADQALKISESRRGYIAVKCPQGILRYFPVGEHTDIFVNLNPYEGLCGEVFKSGQPINEGNVKSHPAYIPSDHEINSEIIMPIQDRMDDPIGVINMESNAPNAYRDEHLQAHIRKLARDAVRPCKLIGKLPVEGVDGIVSGLLDCFLRESTNQTASSDELIDSEKRITQALKGFVKSTLVASNVEWWKNDPVDDRWKPNESIDIDKQVAQVELGDGAIGVLGRIFLSGERIGVLGVEWSKQSDFRNDIHVPCIEQICRVVGNFIGKLRQEVRAQKYLRLIDLLSSNPWKETLLDYCAGVVPELLASSHCTIFFRWMYGGSPMLIPGFSSVAHFAHKKDRDDYYRWDEAAGLTPWVAVKGKPLNVMNVEDCVELKRIDASLVWSRNIAEDVDARPIAFLAYPIFAPSSAGNSNDVIGVIRTFRQKSNRRSIFTEGDEMVFRTIAALLSSPLSQFITRRSGDTFRRPDLVADQTAEDSRPSHAVV